MSTYSDYYVTMTHADGAQSGPTRLLGVRDRKEAKRVVQRQQEAYPGCTFELFESRSNQGYIPID